MTFFFKKIDLRIIFHTKCFNRLPPTDSVTYYKNERIMLKVYVWVGVLSEMAVD